MSERSAIAPTRSFTERFRKDALMRQKTEQNELLAALKSLHEVCQGVELFGNCVTSRASVKDIRRVDKFIKAFDRAEAAIAKAEGR